MSLAALGAALFAWGATSALGALLLALVAGAFDRLFGERWPAIAAALWWAVLVRLVLPGGMGSPVGVPTSGTVELAGPAERTHAGFVVAALAVWVFGSLSCCLMAARGLCRERRLWSRLERTTARRSTQRLARRCAAALGLARVPIVAITTLGLACIGLVRP